MKPTLRIRVCPVVLAAPDLGTCQPLNMTKRYTMLRTRWVIGGLSLAFLVADFCAEGVAANGPDSTGIEFFEKQVRPVLVDHCYSCHSEAAEKLKGGLLLDTKAGVLKGGDSGPAIVPGDPDKSLLIKAVRYTDKDLKMPPKDKRLSDEQI